MHAGRHTEKQRKLELLSKGGQESFRKILNWEVFVREFQWLLKTRIIWALNKQHKQFNFKVVMDNEEVMINRKDWAQTTRKWMKSLVSCPFSFIWLTCFPWLVAWKCKGRKSFWILFLPKSLCVPFWNHHKFHLGGIQTNDSFRWVWGNIAMQKWNQN